MEFVYFAAVTLKQLILGNISGGLQEFPNGINSNFFRVFFSLHLHLIS